MYIHRRSSNSSSDGGDSDGGDGGGQIHNGKIKRFTSPLIHSEGEQNTHSMGF